MKNVLMIAYHYPPVGISSGVHRTLKFSQYLLQYGWKPIVLTVNPKAYERVNNHQLKDIPPEVHVERAFGLDTAKHLSLSGRYPGFLALPDRWVSWTIGGLLSGMKLIKRYKPDVIWSTYPIATAHLIGLVLHKLSGIDWVADFRDSMTEPGYPAGGAKRKFYLWIERKAVENATRVVFTTPGAVEMYAKRYPHIPESRWAMIANGFDEENFLEAERQGSEPGQEKQARFTLVHSGLLYPSERDPRQLFAALAELKQEGKLVAGYLRIVLRATGHDDHFTPMLEEAGINDLVVLEPPVNYGEALREMLESDGLLVFQAANCNHQIPAKIYEYLRARRPIFALTDPEGDTAGVLTEAGIDTVVRLDNKESIKAGLLRFLQLLEDNRAPVASDEEINRHSRQSRTKELVALMNMISGSHA